MAMEYFLAYHSYLESMEPLSDAERGRLFTALLEYSRTGIAPELRGGERYTFAALKGNIDRDVAKYNAKCAKNKESAAKRWDANACDGTETDANYNSNSNSTTTPASTPASTSASASAPAPASASRGEGGAEGGKFSTVSTEFSTAPEKHEDNRGMTVEKPVDNVQNPAYTYDRESLLRQIVGSRYASGNAFRPSSPSSPSSRQGLVRVFGGGPDPYDEEDGFG